MAQYTLSYRPSVNVNNLSYVSADTIKAKKAYLKAFGSPDSNLFYLEGMDFLSLSGINFLYQLQNDIAENVPYLKESYSIINLFPPSTQLPLKVGDAQAIETAQWLRQRALASPAVAERLISEDGRKALIVMDFKTMPTSVDAEQKKVVPNIHTQNKSLQGKQSKQAQKSQTTEQTQESAAQDSQDSQASVEKSPMQESPYITIGRAMEQIENKYKKNLSGDSSNLKIWLSGAAHIIYQQFSFYVRDLSKIFLLLLVVMLLLIFVMLRSWLAFFGTLLSSFVANWLTIGLMSLQGIAIDLTFLMVPVTIGVATAIGYSVHYYNHFKHSIQHTSVDTALGIAWLRCVRPITFTALTTMFSFLSLHLVPIRAIQATGYACLIEVFVIYILTMTLFPLVLSFSRFKKKHKAILQQSKWAFAAQLEKMTSFSFRYRKSIIIISGILFLIMLYYTSTLKANYKFSEFMGSKNQVVQDLQYLEKSNFAPIGTVNIVIYNEDGLMQGDSLAMLQNLDKVLTEMQQESIIKHIFWLGTLIEDAATLKGKTTGVSSIQSKAELNGLMLLTNRLSRFDSNSWLSKDGKSLRILLEVETFESLPFVNLTEKYKKRLEDITPGANVFFTGFIMDTSYGDLVMTKSFIKSIIVSILIVFFLLLLIFRRFYITLISMIPNVFPIIVVGGIISLLGIHLNSFNFLMFPMVIGLIVDDTIHFFYTFVNRFDSSRNYEASIHATLSQVGPALVETTIILCSTFAVFWFSNFQGLAYMGVFTVFTILIALIADLILGPICLSLLPKRHLRSRAVRKQALRKT